MRRSQRGRSFELGGLGRLGSSEVRRLRRRGAGRAPTVVAPGGIAGEVSGRSEAAGVGLLISTGASGGPAILLECATRAGR